MTQRARVLLVLERVFLGAGALLLLIYGAARIQSVLSSRIALREFDRTPRAAAAPTAPLEIPNPEQVDFRLWSEKRVGAYRASRSIHNQAPLAVLRIEKLGLRVPVLEGTDELTLNRGVGWIAGTAMPGETGNIGIAGHRDGFFRGLKDISKGDTIELATGRGATEYVVDAIEIVGPENVEVLRPRAAPSVTLVTCYPFYFIGDAPQRFIVHATRQRPGRVTDSKETSASIRGADTDKEENQR